MVASPCVKPPGVTLPHEVAFVSATSILLIDGRDVRSMSPISVHLALEGEPGTTVHLTVQRGSSIERILVGPRAPGPPLLVLDREARRRCRYSIPSVLIGSRRHE